MLSTREKIKIILDRTNKTVGWLADRLGMSRQNLSNKLSRDNFTERDLEAIAKALNCEYKSIFVLEDGTEI